MQGRHDGHREHPFVYFRLGIARVLALKMLASLTEGHVIILHTGVFLHAFVLETEARHDAYAAAEPPFYVDTQLEIRHQGVAVQPANAARKPHGSRSSDGITQPCRERNVVFRTALCLCCAGCQDNDAGQDELSHGHFSSFSQMILTLSTHKVEPMAPMNWSPRLLEENTMAKL